MKIYDKEKAFNANYSNKLQKMSEETRELIMASMTHEIEFYEFCNQRLQTQFERIKLNERSYILVLRPSDCSHEILLGSHTF